VFLSTLAARCKPRGFFMAMDGRYAENAGAFFGDAMDGRYTENAGAIFGMAKDRRC
jgi:hypothetical protein